MRWPIPVCQHGLVNDDRVVEDVADRLFASIEAGDIDSVRALYAPDAVVWHNGDGVEEDVEHNLSVLGWCVSHIAGMRYEQVRRQVLAGGFVQQHILRGTGPGGAPLEVPACLVVAVAEGRITRIDEYLDSAHLGPLRG